MSATVYERHGPLSFARGGKGNRYACRGGFHGKGVASARWRVAICGYPVLDKAGDQIRVCERCRLRICEWWDEAREGQAVAA